MEDKTVAVALSEIDSNSPNVWDQILLSWDLQQGAYLEFREERFEFMIQTIDDYLAEETEKAFTVLDLGTGPGSLAIRLLDRFEHVRVIAIDSDPLLLEIARNATAKYGDRCVVLDADFRDPSWVKQVEAIGFSKARAAVSTTALHWLSPTVFTSTIRLSGQLMSDGAIFLNGDHMMYELAQPTLASLAKKDQDRAQEEAIQNPNTVLWEQWWEEIEKVDVLKNVAEQRRRWLQAAEATWGERHGKALKSISFYKSVFDYAGFAEADSIWQLYNDRILAAFRDESLDSEPEI